MATSSKHFDSLRARLPSMAGKTAVITGTTSGTGQVAASVLAELGAKVLLLNRASTRSESSLASLVAANPKAEIVAVECDLQSFKSVTAAADRVQELCPEGVHVLCNNAGVMAMPDQATGDGFDVQMQTNHLSHFLLTRELWPALQRAAKSSGEARVVNHTSAARKLPGKTLIAKYLERKGGDLGGDGSGLMFNGPRWIRYNQSKLANAAFTAALHHRASECGSQVKALVAHPGLANTQLQQTSVKSGGMGRLFNKVLMSFSQTTEDGALGILSCICLPDATSGQFYGPGSGAYAARGPARPFALEGFYDNDTTRELLWSKSCEAIGKDFVVT